MALNAVSVLALAGVIAAMALVQGTDAALYPWGLLAIDAAAVSLIATVVLVPGSMVARGFGLWLPRQLGVISYGLYLWHFPLFLWLDQESTGLSGPGLLALRLAVTLGVAVVSYVFIEQPVRQRRWPAWLLSLSLPAAAGAGVVSLALAGAAMALPASSPVVVPPATTTLAGSGPACAVRLTNTSTYGTVAPAAAQEDRFEYTELERGTLVWPAASSVQHFTTCPPKRVLVVGDSIAFSMGVPELSDEASYGTEVADAAILGCAFGVQGQIDVNGTWEVPHGGCQDDLDRWMAAVQQFNPQVVVIELGYRDEFNWRWNGREVHLGDADFDAYVQARADAFVRKLGGGSARKLLFLSVPFTDPPAAWNGGPAPQASVPRHTEINQILTRAAATDGQNAAVLNVDTTISPGGRYDQTVNGQDCRPDGIHVTIYCAKLLEPRILTAARTLLAR